MKSIKVTILNPSGLHARPASTFVQAVKKFKSNITLKKAGQTYNAKSIISVMSACVKCQEEVEFLIEGEDEELAAHAVESAIKSGLGESA